MTGLVALDILRLGARGEGVAAGPVYLPDALPGERVLAEVEGERGRVAEIVRPSADRVAPICPYYGRCGGCAIQSLAPVAYAAWKRDLLVTALSMARVDLEVGPLVPAHGAGRRRVTVHARAATGVNVLVDRPPAVGFMQARTHDILDIAACPILAPGLDGALPAARALAMILRSTGKPLDILVTATPAGLDVDLRGCGPLDEAVTRRVTAAAQSLGLARLSNHGTTLLEVRPPVLHIGRAAVHLPPGSFLQPTEAGEAALATAVADGVGEARRVLDLFCGIGTFALRLAERATVHAVDLGPEPLQALRRAAGGVAERLRPVTTDVRDLVRRPLPPSDLQGFDAVVFDPPRAGAQAQAEQLAASSIPTVVAVSCNPATFARDAAILIRGGYRAGRVTPIDQFLYSPHLEVVAVFRRPVARGRKRALLS